MAVVNLTPDSFSGDGIAGSLAEALARIEGAIAEGADIVDIGGESTRPGAIPVSAQEEMSRILPTLEAIADRVPVPLSVDTRKASVAAAALALGVQVINDVSGLTDPQLVEHVARAGAGLVLVHAEPPDPGGDILHAVVRGLERLVTRALSAGVHERKLLLDPGLGFGKTWRMNLEIVRGLSELRSLGLPLLVGPSRKGTIGRVLGLPASQRLEGTAALLVACIAGGADVVRVHDVRAMVRVARMADVLARPQPAMPA